MRIFSAALLATAIAVATMVVGWSASFFSAGAQEVSADANVRISAQRLENGRVQFGLRALDDSGEYAAPVEPRVNSFNPASTRTGRWLASSSLILEVDESGRGRFVPSEQFEPAPPSETTLVSGIEEWAGDIRYSAFHDADGDLVTTVSVYSAATGATDGELRTTIICQDGETSVTLGGLSSEISKGATARQINVSWRVDGGAADSERQAAWPVEGGTELLSLPERSLPMALLGAGSTLALSIQTTPVLTTMIDLAALRDLSVYSNLVHCARDAVASKSGHTELRIRAQLREDKLIEFAVQQRTDRGWSDNILPRARLMPAFGDATNWLSSTPVSLNIVVAPVLTIISPDPVLLPVAEPTNPILRSGWRTASLEYAATLHEAANLDSIVTVHGKDGLQLQVGCFGDVSRIQLVGASFDATVASTVVIDDVQFAVNLNVTTGDGAATLRPADTERMTALLRRAQSLSVTLGTADLTTVTFALSGLFETPIQANIDQCGNYTDPAWRPVTEAQSGTTEAGGTYWLNYPEWNDGQRATQVAVDASGDAAGPDEQPVRMNISCQSTSFFRIENLPSVDGEYTVRSRVDDGEWIDEAWRILTTDSGWTYANFQTGYERLRNGTTVEYEIPLSPVVRVSFSLTDLFGTPVQANIDNCGVELWPNIATYVPIGNARGRVSASISYSSLLLTDGVISTNVASTTASDEAPDGMVGLIVGCGSTSGLLVDIIGLETIEGTRTDITLAIDDRVAESSLWTVNRYTRSDRAFASPRSLEPERLIAQLRGASVVIVEILGSGLDPFTFDIEGMFDSPIQDNLEECGYYKRGETRTLRPDFATCANDPDEAVSDDARTTAEATIKPSGWMAKASTLLAEAYHRADGVWPGFVPTEHPVVLAQRSAAGKITELLAINVSAPERLGEAEPLATAGTPFCSLARVGELNEQALSVLSRIPNFDFRVDFGPQVRGLYVMIVDLGDDRLNPFAYQEWREFVMHEMFHHYQGNAFVRDDFNHYFTDYAFDAGNLELAALEDRALRAASTAADSEARLQAARHFVAIRFWRAAREPRVTHDEGQERREGTPRYLERRLGFRYASDGSFQLVTDPEELLGGGRDSENGVKYYYAFFRFYETGAAIIRLLDQFEVKDVVNRIEAGLSPAQVLADHLGVGQEMAEGLLAEARAAYDPGEQLPALATRLAAAAAREDWDGPGG